MTPDHDAIRSWLGAVYGDLPGYLPVVTITDGTVRRECFATDDLDRATDRATSAAATTNVYVNCLTLAETPPPGRRGSAADTLAMPGVWCDLDVAGPGHKRPTGALPLPPREDALALVDDLGLNPTAVIDSGGGFYLWFLFREPLVFRTEDDRAEAARLSTAFGSTLVELNRRRGYHLDNTADLARVLRPPGTVNRKREPVAVRLVALHPECRYTPAELSAVCITPEAEPPAQRATQQAHRPLPLDGRESPAEAFSRLVSWSDILEPAGFRLMHEHGGAAYWRHPAATSPKGTPSAATDHEAPVLVVFSESTAAATGLPCGSARRLTKFRAWCILNFRGDESAAARALRAMGRRTA